MILFNKRKKEQETPPQATEQKRTFGPTKKKKNTYLMRFDGLLCDTGSFELCKMPPLPVVKINGQEQPNSHGFVQCKQFPNPGAAQMQTRYPKFKTIMGDMARMVIEYLDKNTNEPVAYLYPDSLLVMDGYEEKYNECLNHATRRDLQKQIEKRTKALEQLNSCQR